MIVRVHRSPLRLLGYALVAVPMVLLALDMLFFYRYYPNPETTQGTRDVQVADGSVTQETLQVYTQTGLAQSHQVLRDVGLAVARDCFQVTHTSLTGAKRQQQLQARR